MDNPVNEAERFERLQIVIRWARHGHIDLGPLTLYDGPAELLVTKKIRLDLPLEKQIVPICPECGEVMRRMKRGQWMCPRCCR